MHPKWISLASERLNYQYCSSACNLETHSIELHRIRSLHWRALHKCNEDGAGVDFGGVTPDTDRSPLPSISRSPFDLISVPNVVSPCPGNCTRVSCRMPRELSFPVLEGRKDFPGLQCGFLRATRTMHHAN